MLRRATMAMAAASVILSSPLAAQPLTTSVPIDPTGLTRIGTIDPRFQSYNVEMLEVVGGEFWKPYDGKPLPQSQGHGGIDPAAYQYRPPIDLRNARLRTLAKALGPAYLRVSGTWANSIYFADSDTPPAQPPTGFKNILTRAQWRGVVDFARAVDARIITSFAISPGVRDAEGKWTDDQARRWLAYTRSIGGDIAAAEFMNEPSIAGISGAPKGYDAAAYGRDFRIFRQFMTREAPGILVLGPGSATETRAPWAMPSGIPGSIASDALLAAAGPGIDAFSYHHYGAASIRCASAHFPQTQIEDALSEEWLGRTSLTRDFYAGLRDRFAPNKPLWLTEGADAACGGNPWGGTFPDSFRYLDQLGRLARSGVQVAIHNTLAASNYALLDPVDLAPKANYWAALLWHRLMGSTVLDAGIASREGLHLYAHCQPGTKGGVTLLAINNSPNAPSSLRLQLAARRYTLSAPDAASASLRLNGALLTLGKKDQLPRMNGVLQAAGDVTLAPTTISFFAMPLANNPICR